ncbi:MAG TPA: hypothetical protein VFL57_01530 [Bryobacteraceae bacterium]|nr:hypothetical protein [Bryobacteraceae bacterium]
MSNLWALAAAFAIVPEAASACMCFFPPVCENLNEPVAVHRVFIGRVTQIVSSPARRQVAPCAEMEFHVTDARRAM